MAGTIVHLAFSGMIAAAFLGAAYDHRSLLVVLGVTALPDLDSFIALVSVAGHRTVLHTFLIPTAAGLFLWVDTSIRDQSLVRSRWGAWGVRVAWVSILVYAVSAIGLDMVRAGVNAFWPVHDQFYVLDGKIELSDQQGVIQTFVEFGGEEESIPAPESVGSSQEINYSTGVDPDPSGEVADPERIFPVVRAGWEMILLVVGTVATVARFYVPFDLSAEE
ncbi:MAG: metal-dependent hydrolase [Haloarculaceae archaeon]